MSRGVQEGPPTPEVGYEWVMVRADVGAPPQAGDGDFPPDQDMVDGDPGRPKPARPVAEPSPPCPRVAQARGSEEVAGGGAAKASY